MPNPEGADAAGANQKSHGNKSASGCGIQDQAFFPNVGDCQRGQSRYERGDDLKKARFVLLHSFD